MTVVLSPVHVSLSPSSASNPFAYFSSSSSSSSSSPPKHQLFPLNPPPTKTNGFLFLSLHTHNTTLLFTLSLLLSFLTTPASSATFNCSASPATTCQSLIDYVPANTTTLNAIKTLFNISHLGTLLGANNLPLSTASTQNVTALQKILIPFTCLCSNGTGVSNKRPQYIVKPRDDC